MATMIAEVYDAFVAAGAPEEKARKAAEAVAAFESRFGQIENRFLKLEGDLNLLKWMAGFNLALSAGIVMLLLRP
jgi:hypothetical protein